MSTVKLTIDGQKIEAPAGQSILEAARSAGIYIPTLCSHPDLPPAEGSEAAVRIFQQDKEIENVYPGESAQGCGMCVVELQGGFEDLVRACNTEVKDGMAVVSKNERITSQRQKNLVPILARHPHACLACAQRHGCSRSSCPFDVPEKERCCSLFGNCELQDVVEYVGIPLETPGWAPSELPVIEDTPLFTTDYNLCIGCTRCIRVCRTVRGVGALGFVYDAHGDLRVGTVAPGLEDSGCKFCTACVEVCPTGALMDKAVRSGQKDEALLPCKEACPVHLDVPEYIRLIGQGKRDEANRIIREKVPFPRVLGRICPAPCEDVCRRAEINHGVAVCALKRYAADGDRGLRREGSKVEKETGRRAAVVGAGPAGLTAAFYLRKKGHRVAVFEAREESGGMMRYGIPEFRLPSLILDQEVQEIWNMGVEFRPNHMLGRDFTLEGLKEEGYEAVFLGVGAQASKRVPWAGMDSGDFLYGLDFLEKLSRGEEVRLKGDVAVLGGGNTAVDAARSALRCGAGEVTIISLENYEEMPAYKDGLKSAFEEGLQVMNSWGLERILIDPEGRIKGVELVRCTSVFDEKGDFSPAFDRETKKRRPCDYVIVAAGQIPDLSFLEGAQSPSVNEGLIRVNEETCETNLRGVYAGGDAVGRGGSVISAIADGRKAASSIDRFLGGNGDIEEVLSPREKPDPYIGRDEGFASWTRQKMPEIDLEARLKGFDEVALGFDDAQALHEAARCLQCDLRLFLNENPPPPERLLPFEFRLLGQVPEQGGVYQLYDKDLRVLVIQGCPNLREELMRELEENPSAVWFCYEESRLYSLRESELIQQYIQEHGEMPGGGDSDLEDLF